MFIKPKKKFWIQSTAPYYSVAASGFSLTFVGSAIDAAGGTTVTYTSVGLGAAVTGRVAVVAVSCRDGTPNISSMTVAGVAATQVASAAAASSGTFNDIWQAPIGVTGGTAANIVITYGGSSLRSAIDVYRLITTTTNASGAVNTQNASGTSLTTASLTVPSGGGAIAIFGSQTPAVATDITWTNAVKDNTAIQVGAQLTAGSATVVATGTITATISGASVSNVMLSAAAWGP